MFEVRCVRVNAYLPCDVYLAKIEQSAAMLVSTVVAAAACQLVSWCTWLEPHQYTR